MITRRSLALVLSVMVSSAACGSQDSGQPNGAAADGSVISIFYAVPDKAGVGQAELFVTSSDDPAVARQIGVGTGPALLNPNGGQSPIGWVDPSGRELVANLTESGQLTPTVELEPNSDPGAAAVLEGGAIAYQHGPEIVSVADSSTRVLGKLAPLPVVEPPPYVKTAYQGGGAGTVTGLTEVGSDQLIAATSDGFASELQIVGTSTVLPLGGYGWISSVTSAADGQLYVLASKAFSEKESKLDVIVIERDLSGIDAKIPTEMSPSDLLKATLLALPNGDVVAYVTTGDTDRQESTLQVVHAKTAMAAIKLPSDVGLYATVADDSSIYAFGGRARNNVTKVNVNTGEVAPVPEISAPDGTFVFAVIQ